MNKGKKILAVLLTMAMFFTSTLSSYAQYNKVDNVITGQYEKWEIVPIDNGDKIFVDKSDVITLEMVNKKVLNWTYDLNGLYFVRDDKENPHYEKEYQYYDHYWATLTSKHPGKYVVDGNAYDFDNQKYYKVMNFTIIVNDSTTVKAGKTEQLSAIMNGEITWKSENEDIVTVDQSGLITGVSGGDTKVTATDADGDVVTFTVEVEGKEDYFVMVGDTKQISNIGLSNWKSLDESIVTVDDNGMITGVKLGKAGITATDSTGKEVAFKVSVTELEYFNTNVFDYKDNEAPTTKKWEKLSNAVYLDSLDLSDFKSGWGPVGTDSCGACIWDYNDGVGLGFYNENGELVEYESGISLHSFDANSTQDTAYVNVAIPEGMKYFTAIAAINQCRIAYSDVKMQFKATAYDVNNEQVGDAFDSGILSYDGVDNRYKIVNLNVEGASYIKLEFLDGGNGNGSDHGVFADAKFTSSAFDQNTRISPRGIENNGIKGINDYTKDINADDTQNLYFVGGAGDDYYKGSKQNAYTGSNAVVKGIAQDTLDGPYFRSNYTEPGLFDTVANSGKDVFTNVKFPFAMDVDGYYTFDSGEMDAAFNDGIGESGATLNWYGRSAEYNGVENADGDKTGFFPFNDTKGAETYSDEINYWYGMNMAVDFYMMNSGYLDDKKEEPIVFEFSGDDDVWVYVDGKLVLDLGGIHSEANGSIDFGARKISTTDEQGNIVEKSLEEILGSNFWYDSSHDENDGDNKLHSLEVFYLERGKNASNLKVRFNLPQKDQLTIEKVFDNNNVTEEEKAELFSHDFWFKLEKDGKPYVNADFTVLENGTIVKINQTTNTDGGFSLKYGQKAVFVLETPRQEDHTYQVAEYQPEGQDAGYWNPEKFTTSWESRKNHVQIGGRQGRFADMINVPAKVTYDRTNVDVYSYLFHNYRNTFLEDDVVVIDYGKKMNIDVFANDELFTKRDMTLTNPTNTNGTFTVGNESVTGEQRVVFTPNAYMDEIETTDYTVKNTYGENQTAKVTVVPATTVYYEDDFPGITFNGEWSTVGESTTDTDVQDDGTVGAGNNYGYDSTYDGNSLYSAGGAHFIDGKGRDTNASFTFKGTGFDIISNTNNETGRIRVVVNDSNGKQVYAKLLDTVYQTEGENLYQIPVIRKTDLAYDEYTVTITVLGDIPSTNEEENTRFYLDAIRVYEPLGKDNEEANKVYEQDKEYLPFIQEVRNFLIDQGTLDITEVISGIVYIDGKDGVFNVGEYEEKGPNNEVYLKQDSGVITTLKTESGEAPKSIQLGLKAPNCNEKGEAEVVVSIIPTDVDSWYDEDENYIDDSKWIRSKVIRLDSATDMYLDLKDYFVNEDGEPTVDWDSLNWSEGVTIGIANPRPEINEANPTNPDAIVSITNLKTTGENVYTNLQPKLLSAFLKAMNTNDDTLTINRIDVDSSSSNVNFTVNTSSDITTLNVIENGKSLKIKKLNSYVEEDGTITWNFTLNIPANKKSHTVDVYAYDTEGNKSKASKVSFSVKKGGK